MHHPCMGGGLRLEGQTVSDLATVGIFREVRVLKQAEVGDTWV